MSYKFKFDIHREIILLFYYWNENSLKLFYAENFNRIKIINKRQNIDLICFHIHDIYYWKFIKSTNFTWKIINNAEKKKKKLIKLHLSVYRAVKLSKQIQFILDNKYLLILRSFSVAVVVCVCRDGYERDFLFKWQSKFQLNRVGYDTSVNVLNIISNDFIKNVRGLS